MEAPEPEIITEMRQTIAERPALVPAMLIALHERDEVIADLVQRIDTQTQKNLELMRDNHRLRLAIAAHRRLAILPRPILEKIAAEIERKE